MKVGGKGFGFDFDFGRATNWVRKNLLPALSRIAKRGKNIIASPKLVQNGLLLAVALFVGVLGVNWINSGKPILGLRVEGQMIGHLAGINFENQAQRIIEHYENQDFAVRAASETSHVSLRQLGVKVDRGKIYNEIIRTGRSGNVLEKIAKQALAPLGQINIHLGHPGFDADLAKSYLETLNQKVDTPPINAHFVYKDEAAAVQPEVAGQAIDIDAAVELLRHAEPGKTPEINLPIKQVPAEITAKMLEPLLPQVQSISAKPLTIVAGDNRASLSPEELVSLVVIKIIQDPENPENQQTELAFDEDRINAIANEVASPVVRDPKPRIMSGSSVVQQGESGMRVEGAASASVLASLIQRQTGAAEPDEAHIPLVTIDPPVIQQVTSNPRTRTGTGLIRLTFDDGPGGYTDQVLDILARYNVRATFYVIGQNVHRYPGQMQRTINEGHRVCNHSLTHANLARLSRAGVVRELTSATAAIQQTIGVTPNCFRPPYGAYNNTVREVAASLGMSFDMWSIDTRDWARPGVGAIVNSVLNNTHSGAVVLMHVLNQQSVSALPAIIEGIRAQGYTLE